MAKHPKKILIVEDERPMAGALLKKFAEEGFEVLWALNGEDGLKLALEQKPALILLDIVMPKMDGITMLDHLRKSPAGKKIPVIILSNLSDSKTVRQAMKAGVHDYLVKTDWKLADLVEEVKKLLGE